MKNEIEVIVKPTEEIQTNVDHEDEHVEEEAVDVELQKAMKNAKIDDSAFGGSSKPTEPNKKDSKGKKANKKAKGLDFIDYANKNGIQVNLQYEVNGNQTNDKKERKPYPNNDYNKGGNNYNNNANNNNANYNNNNSNYNSTYKNKRPYNPNYKNINENHEYTPNDNYSENSTYYQKSYDGQGSKPFIKKPFRGKKGQYKIGDNKFDLCNMHLPQMMGIMQPQYNPYFMQQQREPMQNQYYGKFKETGPVLVDSSDKAIVEYLAEYLSIENLNKDLYLRNRIDENGYIEGTEIANHYKLKNMGITLERLTEILNENVEHPIIEAGLTEDDKVIVRNRDFENIKSEMVSKETIFQNRKVRSQHVPQQQTLNYVTLQNNYFFANHQGQSVPLGENMNMGYGYQNYQQYNPNMYMGYPQQLNHNANIAGGSPPITNHSETSPQK
jgi:hypothetical protein